jgi:hypothetical protein
MKKATKLNNISDDIELLNLRTDIEDKILMKNYFRNIKKEQITKIEKNIRLKIF